MALPTTDKYRDQYPGGLPALDWPADSCKAVTLADGADLPDGACRSFFITADGNVSVIFASDADADVRVLAVKANSVYPFRVRRIRVTGTTVAAGAIFALY